jgi:hypothetical protein
MDHDPRELSRRMRYGEGTFPIIATAGDLRGLSVELNDCHRNVERWVGLHPQHVRVRGWLVTSVSGGGYIFDKHSIVDTGAEALDITPRRDPLVRAFLNFAGTAEEFEVPPHHLTWAEIPPGWLG